MKLARLGSLLAGGFLLSALSGAGAETLSASRVFPNLPSNLDHPLRYQPQGGDFVIENGPEFFNRSLYGGNTAFRVDGGDKPEFMLYLPGRGGNLRLGVRSAAGARWLQQAAEVVTRYRPGELLYEIRDPLLGASGVLRIEALAYDQTEGLIVRATREESPAGLDLVWAYGGITGKRGARDGDIGTEKVPIGQYFQLEPGMCQGNTVESRRRRLYGAGQGGDDRRPRASRGQFSPPATPAIGRIRPACSPIALLPPCPFWWPTHRSFPASRFILACNG